MIVIDDASAPYGGTIYAIVNLSTWRTYVGATAGSAYRRLSLHANALRRNQGVSKALQADWDTYGETAFLGGLVEAVPSVTDLPQREAFWIAEMERQGVPLYNHRRATVYPEIVAKTIAAEREQKKRRARPGAEAGGGE